MPRPPALLLCPVLLLGGLLVACDLPQGGGPTATTTTTIQAPASRDSARSDSASGLPWVDRASLPREGQTLLGQIERGGPFRYSKDGATFGNREGQLPRRTRGHYREYTVRTPGENDRGARRLVCGGQPVTSTAECYYTADHYASFRRVRP